MVFEVRYEEPNEAYHADREHWSCSQLKDFLVSPSWFHRRHILHTEPSLQSEALARGTLVHLCLELGFEEFGRRSTVIPAEHLTGTGQLSTKADTKKWIADQKDSILLTPKDAEFFTELQGQITLNRAVASLLDRVTVRECSVRWQRTDGTKLRCRPDAITSDGLVVDYKTTSLVNPAKEFWSACRKYEYGLQAALYSEGCKAAGLSDKPLVFVVISTVSPYTVIAGTLPEQVVALGRARLDRALADLSARMSFADWTPDGYGTIGEFYFPPFALKDNQGGDA